MSLPKHGLIDALILALGNPHFMGLMRDLDKAESQACQAGLGQRFKDNWAYELERSRTTVGECLTPADVLQITLSQKVPE